MYIYTHIYTHLSCSLYILYIFEYIYSNNEYIFYYSSTENILELDFYASYNLIPENACSYWGSFYLIDNSEFSCNDYFWATYQCLFGKKLIRQKIYRNRWLIFRYVEK